jgi:DNA-binding response OmpR family regulator
MSSEEQPNARILIVEDDLLAAKTASRLLSRVGFVVSQAHTAETGKASWLSSSLDLVVMDYRLPDGTGVDVITHARDRGRTEPVVALTAETESIPDDIRQRLQIDAVVQKPYSGPVLVEAVSAALAGADGAIALPAAVRTAGRFSVIEREPTSVLMDMAEAIQLRRQPAWLAVDYTVVGWDDKDVSLITQLAQVCRTRHGRLAVVVSAPCAVPVASLPGDVDVVAAADELSTLSRRLTSRRERDAVLEAVVAEMQT